MVVEASNATVASRAMFGADGPPEQTAAAKVLRFEPWSEFSQLFDRLQKQKSVN